MPTSYFHIMASATILLFCTPLPGSFQECGSTPGLKEIFIARCGEYLKRESPQPFPEDGGPKCERVWRAWYKAFAFRDPCDVNTTHYEEFIELTNGPPLKNKVLLWSGTLDLARYYAADRKRKLVTIEDTMAGYLVRDLTWCGSRNSPDGINYHQCPGRSECYAQAPFWAAASRQFAMRAAGVTWLLVNGSRVGQNGQERPAYSRGSFFSRFELPNLNPKAVTKLVLVMAYDDKRKNKGEVCGSGSTRDLMADASAVGISVTCVHDDPRSAKMRWGNFEVSSKGSFQRPSQRREPQRCPNEQQLTTEAAQGNTSSNGQEQE